MHLQLVRLPPGGSQSIAHVVGPDRLGFHEGIDVGLSGRQPACGLLRPFSRPLKSSVVKKV